MDIRFLSSTLFREIIMEHHYAQYRNKIIATILRMHVPFTRLYPETHEHKYDPGVLTHCVLLKQISMLFIAASKHSSTSAGS